MTLGRGLSLFKMVEVKVPGPVRPDGFRESVEERTELDPMEDFPTGTEDDIKLDSPDNYGYQEHADRPVGVYITSPIPSDRPLIEWTGGTITLPDSYSTQIGSGDRARRRFMIRNLSSSDEMYITRAQMDLPFAGYTILPGDREEFEHNGPMWARGAAAGVRVTYMSEFVVEEAEHER